ncbi:MFS general substrate transporter [Glarea lozoyensis ATCC 20868]|uniref:MFS general substrate transporter n=1 Tax=Glarea lozoyensis (strain ATCC 20868 / MF5171) TaxID=1116229 RepID=S3DSQ1_GLAL2|nr:MFS general substrate transporter [Glarea lozoyensis ATCC 20868]EPE29458.1 MFS general substrate transporter [Glarea lozoyensis ATCC 20868]
MSEKKVNPTESPVEGVSEGHNITSLHDVDDTEIGKTGLHIKDEAGNIAVTALATDAASAEDRKVVLRKIDLYILPIMCVTYGLQFLDKTALGYSSVFGVIEDNNLKGQQYAWASSIFYFGYLVAEYPGVALIQKLPLAKFLGANIILWAGLLMITASCSSFAGLATARFFLGVFESTITPGFVAITAIWWTREEQVIRGMAWVAFNGVFSTFGGLLTFGIGHMDGALSTWKYIYLILGAITVCWGILFIWIIPDNPTTARWLTEEQKIIAIQRVIENKTGTKSRHFDVSQIMEAFTDPKVILLFLISFVNAIPSGGLSFGSIIISGFGFTPLTTTLLNMPLGAVQTFFTLSAGYLCMKIPNSRLIIGSLCMLPSIVGTILINNLDATNRWGRLVGVWLLVSYPVGFMVLLGLLSTNIAGSTKSTTANGLVFVGYCVGQIAGPQFFKAAEKPAYPSGIKAMLCAFVLNLVLNQVLRLLYMLENRKRDKALEGLSEGEVEELKEKSRIQGFEDVTDMKNVFFRYAL